MRSSVLHAIIAWLVVFVAAGIISTYEIASVEPWTPIHTISFLSQAHPWLAIVVSGLVAAVAGGFEIWWWFIHLRSKIEK